MPRLFRTRRFELQLPYVQSSCPRARHTRASYKIASASLIMKRFGVLAASLQRFPEFHAAGGAPARTLGFPRAPSAPTMSRAFNRAPPPSVLRSPSPFHPGLHIFRRRKWISSVGGIGRIPAWMPVTRTTAITIRPIYPRYQKFICRKGRRPHDERES